MIHFNYYFDQLMSRFFMDHSLICTGIHEVGRCVVIAYIISLVSRQCARGREVAQPGEPVALL
jgi:hypothetical protein